MYPFRRGFLSGRTERHVIGTGVWELPFSSPTDSLSTSLEEGGGGVVRVYSFPLLVACFGGHLFSCFSVIGDLEMELECYLRTERNGTERNPGEGGRSSLL